MINNLSFNHAVNLILKITLLSSELSTPSNLQGAILTLNSLV